MAAPPYHSIGEVLSLLDSEFSDVSISKIRFLESQGLIEPERTPSGYRKFYPKDIARLRWILAQQRDHYLPLKEIKKRIDDPKFAPEINQQATANESDETKPQVELNIEPNANPKPSATTASPTEKTPAKPKSKPAKTSTSTQATSAKTIAQDITSTEQPTDTPDTITAAHLAELVGANIALIRELDRLGLIAIADSSTTGRYDEGAIEVVRSAVVFAEFGIEPRHMRMFKVSAERQAGVLAQVFAARLSKGGETMHQAQKELNELVQLTEKYQRIVLRENLGDNLESRD